jgi:hypothetical protein
MTDVEYPAQFGIEFLWIVEILVAPSDRMTGRGVETAFTHATTSAGAMPAICFSER